MIRPFGGEQALPRMTITMYASITLLAVLGAATGKGYVETAVELGIVAFGTSLGLCIAHFWASFRAEVLTRQEDPFTRLIRHELLISALAFVPAILVAIVMALGSAFDQSFAVASTLALLSLVALLFVAAAGGARALGRSWAVCVGYGAASAALGFLGMGVKVLVGG